MCACVRAWAYACVCLTSALSVTVLVIQPTFLVICPDDAVHPGTALQHDNVTLMCFSLLSCQSVDSQRIAVFYVFAIL